MSNEPKPNNQPTHFVYFAPNGPKDEKPDWTLISGAWANRSGEYLSFPFGNGRLVIRPRKADNEEDR